MPNLDAACLTQISIQNELPPGSSWAIDRASAHPVTAGANIERETTGIRDGSGAVSVPKLGLRRGRALLGRGRGRDDSYSPWPGREIMLAGGTEPNRPALRRYGRPGIACPSFQLRGSSCRSAVKVDREPLDCDKYGPRSEGSCFRPAVRPLPRVVDRFCRAPASWDVFVVVRARFCFVREQGMSGARRHGGGVNGRCVGARMVRSCGCVEFVCAERG